MNYTVILQIDWNVGETLSKDKQYICNESDHKSDDLDMINTEQDTFVFLFDMSTLRRHFSTEMLVLSTNT